MSSENISSSTPTTIVSITDSLTALGLRLTGISNSYEGETKEETEKIIKEVVNDPSVAVIIITQPIAQDNYSLIQYLSSTMAFPIFTNPPDLSCTLPVLRFQIPLSILYSPNTVMSPTNMNIYIPRS